MTTQTAEQFATYLDSIFISEEISSVKAGQIAAMLRSQAAEIERLKNHGLVMVDQPEQSELYGYVSEHNSEGPFKLQFHKQVGEIYKDNCTAIHAVYTAPPLRELSDEEVKLIIDKVWATARGNTVGWVANQLEFANAILAAARKAP